MELLVNLIDEIRNFGFEKVFKRYYGIYRGEVTNNQDEQKRGRVDVKVTGLFGDKVLPTRALPKDMRSSASGKGEFYPPDEGDFVWIEFEGGDQRFPVYSGGWHAKEELPEDFIHDDTNRPVTRGFVSKGGYSWTIKDLEDLKQMILRSPIGNFFILDDTTDAEGIFLIHKSGAQIQIDVNGSIKLFGSKGSFINIDGDPDNAESEITVTSPEGAYMSVGNGVKLSDATGEHIATLDEKGITLNSSADCLINANSLGASVGGISLKDTLQAGLVIGNGQVALGNATIEVVDSIIQVIDALTAGSPLVTTGTGPSSGLLPPALTQLVLLKTLLTTLKGTL